MTVEEAGVPPQEGDGESNTLFGERTLQQMHPQPSCEHLLEWVTKSAEIPVSHRYEFASAIGTMSKWGGVPLNAIPANTDVIRKIFGNLSPGGLDVTRKRIANVKSAVLRALRAARVVPKSVYVDTFLPEWMEVWKGLTVIEKRQLSRLIRYASGRGLTPIQIDDQFNTDFLAHMKQETLIKHPVVAHQNAIRSLNAVAVRLPEAIRPRVLQVPQYMRRLALPDTVFPETLWKEFEGFIKSQQKTDYFDERAPQKPLRATTIYSYYQRFRAYLGALVLAGYKPDEICSLAFCIKALQVKRGLQSLLGWRGDDAKESRDSAANAAILLQTIAKRAVRNPTARDMKFLEMTARKLRVRHKGMSPRSRRRVAALKHPENLARLFIMPIAKLKKLSALEEQDITNADALLFQKCLALTVLMFCPLRIGTLTSLHLDDNLKWAGPDMAGGLLLCIEESQMKGDESVTAPLPKLCSDFVRTYVSRFRLRLAPAESRHLFSGERTDRGKDVNCLSKQLKVLIFDELGFDMTPHVYRHLVHIVILNKLPGAYAMISRVLTHRAINTAIRNYAHFDIELSMKAYQELVLEEMAPGPRSAPVLPVNPTRV